MIYKGREAGMNKYKEPFAVETDARTLADAMVGADVFLGLSVANMLTPEMVKSMNDQPMIFAMANPDPEIPYPLAREARADAIIGTGRSDYPNQVNNVLGFPFIFRGALDVAATAINEEMKIAAARSLAALAKEDVPDSVIAAYGGHPIQYGQEYVIPKALDPRVLLWEAPAVAQAAMETGVAAVEIDIEEYREELARRQGLGKQVKRYFMNKARQQPKRVVFGEGEHPKVIRAAHQVEEEGIAHPILIGKPDVVKRAIEELALDFEPEIVYSRYFDREDDYAQGLLRNFVSAKVARWPTPIIVFMFLRCWGR